MLPRSLAPVRFSIVVASVTIAATLFASVPAAQAQGINGFKNPLGAPFGQGAKAAPKITVTKTLEPKAAKPGDTVTLSIKIEMSEGAYTYSMSPEFGGGTRVKFSAEEGLKATGEFTANHAPKVEYSKELEQDLEKHTGSVTWTRKYLVEDGAQTGHVKGTLKYQVCDSSSCRNFTEDIDLSVEVLGSAISVPKREVAATPVDSAQFEVIPKLRAKSAKAIIRLTPADAKPGDTVSLQFQVKLDKGWHIFSTSQSDGQAATATEFSVDEHSGLEPVDAEFTADRAFHEYHPEIKEGDKVVKFNQEIYEDEVTWTRKFKLVDNTQLSEVRVSGKVLFQVCKESCIQNSVKFTLPASAATFVPPTRGAPESPGPRATTENPASVPTTNADVPPSNDASSAIDLSSNECVGSGADGDPRAQGLLYVLGAAFVAGWLALLTPCVFPMVPITVSFFLKQSEKKHSSPLKLAVVYCLSIIATFTVLGLVVSGLFGAGSINKLANGVAINLFLGIVLLFFSFNLLGLFDIQVPSWLLTFTASKESTSSYFGVFFMALTFTLTSFTCTFAFLGLILVWAANGDFWWPLAGLVAFSTAFALPFFLLALFPSYLQRLPKSGGWMNRVKVIMGLIEMAFMFKFLSVADIAWNSAPTLLDYHLVMSAWMAISIVAGLYLIGKIQLPHDTKEDHVGVIPMVVAMAFFGLAGYLGVGIFGHDSLGGFWGQKIMAFAPPRLQGGSDEDGPYLIGKHDKKKYLLDFDRAKAKAQRDNLPLFIDFTGVNCINCREMEEVMAGNALQGKLDRFVRVQLYTDKVPRDAVSDPEAAAKMLERNTALQTDWMKDASLPGYAVASPDGKIIFSKLLGKKPESTFTTFLDCGHKKWQGTSKTTQVAATK